MLDNVVNAHNNRWNSIHVEIVSEARPVKSRAGFLLWSAAMPIPHIMTGIVVCVVLLGAIALREILRRD
jgi:hypothetical protein